ncbi:SRPBCC family protein [Methylosinus sp. Sm6]|uniref:SRPBCC family protein n=1 Tax=Methylosinus sp. Sm6 TaxID=2866948 RepID=UPI001C99A2CD|nr:SRPBCC family protein [Methylosinus sp. Sm6]MBY6242597.1 SRPBCC family protein [Methylosinus sp. Sm6]
MSFVVARRGIVLAALSLAALAPSTGFAHGPSRQKVTETIEIAAPAEKIWAVIGNFQDLSWLPVVAKTEGTGDNEPNKATRHITLKNGGEIDELLTKYDAKDFSQAYRIEKVDVKVLPVNNYSSTLTVKPQGDKSVVEWKGAFYRGYPNNDPPPELSDEAALKAITGLYQSGLAALKEKVESGK